MLRSDRPTSSRPSNGSAFSRRRLLAAWANTPVHWGAYRSPLGRGAGFVWVFETERLDIKHAHEHSQREYSDNRRHHDRVRTNSGNALQAGQLSRRVSRQLRKTHGDESRTGRISRVLARSRGSGVMSSPAEVPAAGAGWALPLRSWATVRRNEAFRAPQQVAAGSFAPTPLYGAPDTHQVRIARG